MTGSFPDKQVKFLFVHVPKASNYYKLIDEFTFINYLPMGVFAICDLLNREGIPSRISHLGLETLLDENFSIAKKVASEQIPMVGMSLHWHYQSFDVIDIAKKIKAVSPQTKIVLGGLTASRFAGEILREFPPIDAVICGDAESSVVPFARAAMGDSPCTYSEINNCVWRDRDGNIVNNGISYVADETALSRLDFCNLALLDHADGYRDYFKMPMFWMNHQSVAFNLKIRMKSNTMFPLALGRGCPADCSFCGGGKEAQKAICGRDNFVFRSVKSVVDTMAQAIEGGYESFLTCFDPTPQDDSYYYEWLTEIERRGLKCGLAVECWGLPSPRVIKKFSEIATLKKSYIALSPETGAEEIRKRNKAYYYYSNDALNQTMAHLAKYNIPTILYFTAGLPHETSDHMNETTQLSASLKKQYGKIIDGIFCIPVQIEPGSPLFENPEDWGVHSKRSCFMDFYRSHGDVDSGPFDYLGYATNTLAEADGELDAFRNVLQDFRCKHFCVLDPKLFGRLELKKMSRLLCILRHKAWEKKGYGALPKTRRTFC